MGGGNLVVAAALTAQHFLFSQSKDTCDLLFWAICSQDKCDKLQAGQYVYDCDFSNLMKHVLILHMNWCKLGKSLKV